MATPSEQIKTPLAISDAIVREDWDEVKSHLTDDVFYKVGSDPERHGPEDVVGFLKELFLTAKFTGEDVRQIWESEGAVVIEMDAHYLRVKDGKQFSIACVDIYRLQGDKVREWRVYPDLRPLFMP
jgi:limonene-1,2-epoxide hydrolase